MDRARPRLALAAAPIRLLPTTRRTRGRRPANHAFQRPD